MYDALRQPLTIAGTTLRNRVVRTAHGVNLGGEDLVAYHEARARGGVALSIIGAAGVHPTNAKPTNPVYDDAVLPLYEDLARRCHRHGMLVYQQLNHAGSANPTTPGHTQWSSSPTPNPLVGTVPRALSTDMIAEMVDSFARAAARVRDGGLDGVEIHAAHGYLVGQFLSPALNHRTDEYGGPLENRMRFLREVLAAVRATVGPDFPVGVRLVGDDRVPGGLGATDYAEIARLVEPDIDFLDVSLGGYWQFHSMLSTAETPLGYQLDDSTRVTAAVDVPTIVTGRIMTLDHADRIVASGQADLVSMVRATIADPDLVTKGLGGHDDRIRPCIGTNQGCLGGLFTATGFGCVVNTTAGREAHRPAPPSTPTTAPGTTPARVLVVGGGPAGLETARLAALAGHHVELHEARRDLGGQVTAAARVPARSDLAALTHWLEQEVTHLGVTVRRGSFVDLDAVRDIDPDVVVLATGSSPDPTVPLVLVPSVPVPGSDAHHVHTSWDVLGHGGRATLGDHVVLYDDTGDFEAITTCLALLERTDTVTLVSRHDAPGATVPYPPATVGAARELLATERVRFVPATLLTSIGTDHVTTRGVYGGPDGRLPADTVVLVTHHRPHREVADQLDEAGVPYHLVGDANGSRDLHRAMLEAAHVADLITTARTAPRGASV